MVLNPIFGMFLPPATKLGQGNVFTSVCDSVHGGGGWRAWQGACMVGRHAWPGGCVVRGACMARGACVVKGACVARGACVAKGGMHGKGGWHAW